LLAERVPGIADEIRIERHALATGFILHAVADRARVLGRRRRRRLRLEHDEFVDNLVTMIAAAVAAPVK
jgi:hypothetical protein